MNGFRFKWTTAFLVWFAATSAIVVTNVYSSLPSSETLKSCFVARMHQVELCPKSKDYVSLSRISPHLKNAILVSEDTGFYNHNGFELEELKISLRVNFEKGSFARGASTITQQLARNLFLSSEKSLLRKFKEALITYQIEKHLSKNEILERYLNVIEFGDNIYGIKAAAKHYFAKSPGDLNILESSYLAFLLPSPKRYSASYHKGSLTQFGFKRIHQILYRLVKYQRITPEEYEIAKANLGLFPWRGVDLTPVASTDIPSADEVDQMPTEEILSDEISALVPAGALDPDIEANTDPNVGPDDLHLEEMDITTPLGAEDTGEEF